MLKLKFKRVATGLSLIVFGAVAHTSIFGQVGPTPIWSEAHPTIGSPTPSNQYIHAPKKATDSFGNWISVQARMTSAGLSQGLEFTSSHDDGKTWSNSATPIQGASTDSQAVNPEIIGATNGEYIVVWESIGETGNTIKATFIYPIYASFGIPTEYRPRYEQIPLFDVDLPTGEEAPVSISSNPSVATDNFGTWMAAYRSETDEGSLIKVVRINTMRGNYQLPWEPVAEFSCADNSIPKIVASGQNSWTLVYEEDVDGLNQLVSININDYGFATDSVIPFEPIPVYIEKARADASDEAPALASNKDGKLMAVWNSVLISEDTGQYNWLPFYAYSLDNGKKWSTPLPVAYTANSEEPPAGDFEAGFSPFPAYQVDVDADPYQNWVIVWIDVRSPSLRTMNYLRFANDDFVSPFETGIIPKVITIPGEGDNPPTVTSQISLAFPDIKASGTGTWIASFAPHQIVTIGEKEDDPPTISTQFFGIPGVPYHSYAKYFTNHNTDLVLTGMTTSSLESNLITYNFQIQNNGNRRAYGTNIFVDFLDWTREDIVGTNYPTFPNNILIGKGEAGHSEATFVDKISPSQFTMRWGYGILGIIPIIEPGHQVSLAFTFTVDETFKELVKDNPYRVYAKVQANTFEDNARDNSLTLLFPPPVGQDGNGANPNPDPGPGPGPNPDPDPDPVTTPTISLEWTGVKAKGKWNAKKETKPAKLTANVKVKNISTTETLNNVPVRFFHSTDATWSANDAPLNTVTVKKLKPGKTKAAKAKGSVPGPVAGTYILTVFPDDRFFAQEIK